MLVVGLVAGSIVTPVITSHDLRSVRGLQRLPVALRDSAGAMGSERA